MLRDNAGPHSARRIQHEINEIGWIAFPYLPYLPEIMLSEFPFIAIAATCFKW